MRARDTTSDEALRLEAIKGRTNRCPYYQLIGMVVEEMGGGYARLRLPATSRLHQPIGLVHGGAISSVVDGAGAMALIGLLSLEEQVVTVELKVNFLAPVREGELIAEGRVAHRGRRIAVVDVEVRADEQRLVAKALVTFAISRRAHDSRHDGKLPADGDLAAGGR